ncbi:Zinc finger (C3HC4-type RING finger) family protein [Rhynchospora pubera]|uniref:Zinc finger (C3HC4-type RING finger) family protein n=1 Tax=Rhynchospora pubera TaxID=906938 RepID=A0AAV8CY31_9POAL|nr:Zinc finger (C3HC4-type RING finger) family protein [Rhynchospora pubera]
MGTGWRRALCTSVRRDTAAGDSPSPRSCSKISFFSNANTPRGLRCRTKCEAEEEKVVKKPAAASASAPCSPRSPSKFALFKASLLSRGRCGVCDQSVKSRSSGNMAVFTAECGHAFHFPCISTYMRSNPLSCPVCSATWQQPPFLSSLRLQSNSPLAPAPKPKQHIFDDNAENQTPRKENSKPVSSNQIYKVYNDDEPLLKSRVNHGGFNPIPEANEDAELELESESGDMNLGLNIGVFPEAALVSTGRKHGKYVVSIKVKAPPLAKTNHVRAAPVDLVTVLDVGQGMTGDKLQMLKRAVRLVIASLGPSDRLSLVAFSGTAAKRLLPLRRMSRQGQRSARSIVDRLVVAAGNAPGGVAGNACIGDALKKATKVLEDRKERNPVATIMLLSDRQQEMKKERDYTATQQVSTPKATTRFAHMEIPIPEESKTLEATPRKEDAFVRCLGGLVSVVMQNVQLQLSFPCGEILSVYSCGAGQQAVSLPVSSTGRGGRVVTVPLGDLYAEEEKELLLELRAPIQQHDLMSLSARWSYRDPTSRESIFGPEKPLLLPPLDCNISSIHLRDLFVTTRALAESRRLIELMDYATAQHLLSSARSLLLQTQVQSRSGYSSLDRDQLIERLDSEIKEVQSRRREVRQDTLTPPYQSLRRRPRDEAVHVAAADALTPTSAWRAAEQLAKVAIMRKSLNRVSDLHGFENARF